MSDLITIPDRVRAIVAKQLCVPVEKAADDAELTDELGADSLDIVELVMPFEEEFGIEIDDATADRWITAGDLLGTVRERVS